MNKDRRPPVQALPQPKNAPELQQVLLAMLDPVNNRRRAAEACLEQFFKNPACLPAIMQQVEASQNQMARQMAAVLLRKKLSAQLWRGNEKHWKNVQALLLRRLVQEPTWPVRKAIAALASRVAKLSMPDGQWPELIPFCMKLLKEKQESLRRAGMLLFRAMGENLPKQMVENLPAFAGVVQHGLQDSSMAVRAEAFRAMEGIAQFLPDDNKEHLAKYGNLIPMAVASAREILQKGEGHEEEASSALELFNALTDCEVPVLEPFLVPLVQFMLEVSVKIGSTRLSDPAMRFVQSVVDSKPNKLLRAGLIPDVLKAAFMFVVKPDENPFDPDEVTAQKIGVSMLDSLVESVPYKHVFQPCLKTFVQLIKSSSPHQRRGGIAIIAAIAEGFSLLLQECLPLLLDATLTLINDKDPMVRVGACVCLLQLCDHLQPDICAHHERLIPAMVNTLNRPGEHPMVRIKIATALCAFVESLDKDVIGRYMGALMNKFGQLVAASKNGSDAAEMGEMAVGGIQSVAIAAEEKFMPFLQNSVRAMLKFMSSKEDDDLRMRARATDCIGCIAAAVGSQAFKPCLNKVLALADENLTLKYYGLSEATFRLYSNLAVCLGEEFNKILPKVHAYVIACLQSMDGVEIRHVGGDMSAFHKEDAFEDEDDFLKQMEYSIRTGAVDEKAAAVQSLTVIIDKCGRGYLPFVKQTVVICKECLEYPHEFVRHGVAAALHELINLAHKLFKNEGECKMQKGAQAIVGSVLPLLIEMMNEEPDKTCCAEAVEATQTCVESFGMPILQSFGNKLVGVLEKLLREKVPCQAYHGEDEDEKDETDHDEILIDKVTDLLESVAKVAGPEFDPIFRKLAPHLMKFNGSNRSGPDRIMAIGTIGDIAEIMKDRIRPYLKTLFPVILKSLGDPEVGVRRNAAYTVGIFVLHGGDAAAPYMANALGPLQRLYEIPQESKDDAAYAACKDNACSAVSKIIGKNNRLASDPKVIQLFIEGMPLLNDFDEAKEVYPRISHLLRTQGNHMKKMFPRILFICGKVFSNEHIDAEVKNGLIPVAKHVASSLGSNAGNAISGLSNPEKQRLEAILRS